jgi:hypothetical protein
MRKSERDLRVMRQAAMAGDRSAARALLRLYGFDEIAREMKPSKPYSNRVRNAVNCLTAGTGVGDEPGRGRLARQTAPSPATYNFRQTYRAGARAPKFSTTNEVGYGRTH